MHEHSGFNPTTQGKVHPLQREHEVFIGYFEKKFFPEIAYRTKRIVLEAPENPVLREPFRIYPVFVERNEALEKYYQRHSSEKVPLPNDLLRKAGLDVS